MSVDLSPSKDFMSKFAGKKKAKKGKFASAHKKSTKGKMNGGLMAFLAKRKKGSSSANDMDGDEMGDS